MVRASRRNHSEYADVTMSGDSKDDKRQRGVTASSVEFTRYDQVNKPNYHLAESADGLDVFDEDFEFATCDLGRFLHGDAGDKRKFADELSEAMRDIGFAVLEGHGVDLELFNQAEGWGEKFFTTADLASKMRFRAARSYVRRTDQQFCSRAVGRGRAAVTARCPLPGVSRLRLPARDARQLTTPAVCVNSCPVSISTSLHLAPSHLSLCN